MRKAVIFAVGAAVIVAGIAAITHREAVKSARITVLSTIHETPRLKLIDPAVTPADKIVNGAKKEALNAVRYDSSYVRISYPNGDVPRDQGACTDVVIRALRAAGYDLQKLIREDKEKNPRSYPAVRVDPNIDHRRIPNQMVFMRKYGTELPIGTTGVDAATWKPGDIIYWRLRGSQVHCGICSNDTNDDGLPLIIHNIGITDQEDCINKWEIIGHFRYPKANT